MTLRARRIAFGATLATGLSLLGLSIGGMATLDADLRAAAEHQQGGERVNIVDGRDCPKPHPRVTRREI